MECSPNPPDVIEVNSYIVIQRHGYLKLHQLVDNSTIMLGKDKVDLKSVVGKPFWSMFKMVPHKGRKREFDLEMCSKADSSAEGIIKDISYGTDNRNITDDGSSQLLSSEDIDGMRESGLPGQTILEKLVENSKTFKEKTGYSQEKYIKKKEKKYFEYIIIRKPTLRLLSEIFYTKDQNKILGLRHDTLSQIFTAVNLQHNGVYALFENGSQAVVGAGILNYLSDKGLLINLCLGNNPQKQAILAMNFTKEHLLQLVNVKIKDFLKHIYSKCSDESISGEKDSVSSTDKLSEQVTLNGSVENFKNVSLEEKSIDTLPLIEGNKIKTDCDHTSGNGNLNVTEDSNAIEVEEKNTNMDSDISSNKRKLSCDDNALSKKPRWAEDFEKATDAFSTRKLNGIIIVAKEYPLNIINKLLPFLRPSCQLVVYCVFREPLVQLFIELKRRKDVIGLHLSENWLRMLQVLPDRTHPDVNMSFSGYLLTGTKVS